MSESGTQEQVAPQRSATRRYGNFVAKNWRGEYSLAISYWVFGVAGNIAVAIIPLGLADVYESWAGYQPTHVFALIFGVWLMIVVISVWQWVGVWRSAKNYAQQKSLQHRRAPWAVVAKFLTVIAFFQLASTVVTLGIPQVTEVSRIAFMNDPDIPEYFIRVMRSGTEAEITGGIKYGLTKDFKKILRASPQVRVVHLNSVGGRIGEAEELYNLIKDNHLNTYVSAKCMSACTLAFSGGGERVLRHGAVLGFHRGSFAGADEEDSFEWQGQRKIFTAAGYDAQFIARALATPSADMWKPSEEELLKAGVITKVSNGSD